jgi:hypothetical protein
VAIAWLLLVGAPAARALTLLSDDRSVRTRSQDGAPPPVEVVDTPDSPFAPFHVSSSRGASQDSEIELVTDPGPLGILSATASGSAFGFASDLDFISSTSTFSIRFSVDAPAAIVEFSGLFTLTSSYASASVALRAGSTVLFERGAGSDPFTSPPWTTPFQFHELLVSGEYEITAFARGGSFGGAGTGSFSLAMTASEVPEVPEPSPALLVALGSAGLAWLRQAVRRPPKRERPESLQDSGRLFRMVAGGALQQANRSEPARAAAVGRLSKT